MKKLAKTQGRGFDNGWDEARLRESVHEEYRRPFDLAKGPLLRVRLFSRGESDHVFLMTLHHIAFDAWSLWLLQDEFRQLYPQRTGGETSVLPSPSADYSDFVRAQQELVIRDDERVNKGIFA